MKQIQAKTEISKKKKKKKKTTPEKVGDARIIPHKEKVFVRWLRWLI